MTKLSKREIETALSELDGWSVCEDREAIERQLKFNNFNQAFSFMTAIALKAEQMNHHPEWSNIYNRVDIILTTHSEGGVTTKDVDFAGFIDRIFKGKILS